MPTEEDGEPHNCLEETDRLVMPRPDLKDISLKDPDLTLYIDGSCKKNETGTNQSGFAEAAELVALIEACGLAEGKWVNIYTDSAYAFSTVHVFAAQWRNRGMVTSTGKPILHKDLILNLLGAVLLSKAIAICKCAAHTHRP